MSFLFPLGFLALIAVPVLILIYIIKNRYTEQTVASTYLWTLSEKFIKRRVPINRLTGILSLILQIFIIVLIAIIVAQPRLYVSGAEAYCFILDGTGSMNIEMGGSTRFEAAKGKITEIIDNSMNGSTYTLIYVGEDTVTEYEEVTDKKFAKRILTDLKAAYSGDGLNDALAAAQKYFNKNNTALTYLVTDRVYGSSNNVTVINVTSEVDNYAVSGVGYALTSAGLQITGKVVSYASDAMLTLELYMNGGDQPYDLQTVNVVAGEQTDFTFTYAEDDFRSLRVKVAETDSLPLDNEAVVFNVRSENISNTLLVSDSPFFMESALKAAGNTRLDVVKTEDYVEGGYGLYIFDSFTPETLPREGAVWFVNPQSGLDGTNFSFQGEQKATNQATYSTSTATAVRNMLKGVSRNPFGLAKYVKIGQNGKFTNYILCDGNPLLFTGTNAYGNREAVFAFSLRDSAAFTLSADFSTLVSKLLDYSFPTVVENTSYYSGEIMQINMIADCQAIRVETPLGNIYYPDTSSAVLEYRLDEVGVYGINLIMKDGSERLVNVYSALPEAERVPAVTGVSFSLTGQRQASTLDGVFDNLLIIFILLAVIAAADYGVYCYEQYQLR